MLMSGQNLDGRIALEEFDESPEVGKVVKVMLQNRRLVDGVYQFSTKAALQENSWQEFMDKYGNGNDVISGRVSVATNKGKMVDCQGVRAFLPFSLSADLKGRILHKRRIQFQDKDNR